MTKLVFASNNQGKLREIQSLLANNFQLRTLKDCGITEELPEPFFTFQENAWSKANYVFEKTGENCFAEDSGLVVPALDGAPGVWSARYAGEPSNDENNNQKLLASIKNISNKSAYYQAVICLILLGQTHYFEGKCWGHLTPAPKGDSGFGYDPLFIPDGYNITFAEKNPDLKNQISHRAKATIQLAAFLNKRPA
jgi:XTP/dITP diphosphohydrolase